jgi:hypothetical protein
MKNISVFRDITPCGPLKVNRRFDGICCTHFRVEDYAKQETNMKETVSKLKEVTCSSEISVDFQQTTWRYIPEERKNSQPQL